MLELIGRHSDQVDVDSLRIRESNGGRYVSVTVTIVATGKPQLEAIYGELRAHDAVLFFDEFETLFMSRERGNALMTLLLTEIERCEGVAILATNLPQMIDEALRDRSRRLFERAGLPVRPPESISVEQYLDVMAVDKKALDGNIRLVLLRALGEALVTADYDAGKLRQTLSSMA